MVDYLFRKPIFPILVNISGIIFSAKSDAELIKALTKIGSLSEERYGVTDSTGETWDLYSEHMTMSPLTFRKKPTKLQLIKMINSRSNRYQDEQFYSEKSLSSKTYGKIFNDLADIVDHKKCVR